MDAKIWFFGTGGFAARCLEELTSKGYAPSLVVTSPPSLAGRGMKTRISPVEAAATKLGRPLRHSAKVNRDDELLKLFDEEKPQLIFVIDFGQLIGEPWLSTPPCGCLNIHPSLLPSYRGAAPVQRALMDGAAKTGVTLFRLVKKMDAGPVWVQGETEIGAEETAADLLERLAVLGCRLFAENAEAILSGAAPLREQDDSAATVAPKIAKSEAKLDLSCPAQVLHDCVRGLFPAPGAWFSFRGKRVKVSSTRVATRTGTKGTLFEKDGKLFIGTARECLELVTVQPAGKKPMAASDWLKGLHLSAPEPIDD